MHHQMISRSRRRYVSDRVAMLGVAAGSLILENDDMVHLPVDQMGYGLGVNKLT
jgi:hypothetical protein